MNNHSGEKKVADPNNKYILAHDMGTSSNKAILITVYGEIIESSNKEIRRLQEENGIAVACS